MLSHMSVNIPVHHVLLKSAYIADMGILLLALPIIMGCPWLILWHRNLMKIKSVASAGTVQSMHCLEAGKMWVSETKLSAKHIII